MSRRVSPTEAIRAEIDALFTGDRDLVEVLEDVARLGARLIIQTAVEAEVDAFLGRSRYQRAAAVTDAAGQVTARARHRNGHCETTIKTTAGPITVARPKLRGTTEKFASRLFGSHVTRTNALETLVIASFVRGMSVRDVEAALADALGPEAALSKTSAGPCSNLRPRSGEPPPRSTTHSPTPHNIHPTAPTSSSYLHRSEDATIAWCSMVTTPRVAWAR